MSRWWPLVVLAALGCTTARVPLVGEPPPALLDPKAEDAYQAVLERVSARGAVYDGLDTRVFVAATHQSPGFVEVRVRRTGGFKALPQAEIESNLAAEHARLSDTTELLFGVHANDPKFDDFDRPNTIWRLTLVDGAAELSPKRITRLGRGSLDMRALYPYMDTFWVAYVVQFPKATGTGPYVLRVASSLGKTELKLAAE